MFVAMATVSVSSFGQARMTLHEEATGENCPPCASTNPGFWTLCDAAGNAAKLIHITYMTPIPSAGWYCNRTSAIHTAFDAYYSVPFAPYGRYDGHVPNPTASSPGHPGYFTQADIDAEAAIASPFNITMTSGWDPNFANITTTVNVTCVTAYSGTLVLRTALIHTDDFTTAPGTNGELHFANVVQAMYPNYAGTSIPGTWTVGMTQSFVVTGACPTWLDKSDNPYMVAWIQNNADKTVAQAAQATPLPKVTNDAAITAIAGPSGLICHANGAYSLAHSLTLKNNGSATLTSATIYWKVDGVAQTNFAWTGSIAPGATASVTMPSASITITGALYHSVIDSVDMPNSVADKNQINNTYGQYVFIESTNPLGLPYSTSFETVDLGKFDMMDANSNGRAWGIFYATTGSLGHTGANAAKFDCYSFASGESEVMTLPEITSTTKNKMTLYTAHCAYSATAENDKLEVVYSTDCGGAWISVWSLAGAALANLPLSTAAFTPTSASYVLRTVDLSTVPANAILGLRGTSAYGNNIWVDDINVTSTVGVNQVTSEAPGMRIYPNPANDVATLSLSLANGSDVQIQVVDGLGRVMNTVANEKMDAGAHSFTINTSSFATGVYNVMIHTETGTYTQRLTVAK